MADLSAYNPWAAPVFPNRDDNAMQPETYSNPLAQGLLSQLAGAIGRGFMAPGQALQSTTPITSGQMVAPAMDMAGMTTLGAGAIPQEANTLNMGIKAYHGSPHDYPAERLIQHPSGETEYISGAPNVLPDVPQGAQVLQDFPLGRMRMDKIGTGEGAQAYGHGLYTAGNEGVARNYRDALSGMGADMSNPEHVAAMYAQGQSDTPTAIAALRHNANNFSAGDAIRPDVLNRAADLLESGATPKKPGHMYEVNINADPAHFLDWDKPLSEQNRQTQDAVRAAYEKRSGFANVAPYATGQDISKLLGDKGESAQALRDAGIPGIKYLDQGSRGAGQGSSNYVVFNDKLIDILRKYAVPGMMGAPIFANQLGEQKS